MATQPSLRCNIVEKGHNTIRQSMNLFSQWVHLPTIAIDLMYTRADESHPFFKRLVMEFYQQSRARHRKYPIIQRFKHGVAICTLPETFEEYLRNLEASGRRNYKKARRLGYEFGRIEYNDWLGDITEIRQSTTFRQGPVPESILKPSGRCTDPPPTPTHGYPYFGVQRAGKLFAYAGCLVAGEVCLVETLFGHAGFQEDAIVPYLIVGIVQYCIEQWATVRYMGYGTYFGAGESMQRFKRKFGFVPHRVRWQL